ncbi:hypothetical protein B0I35DRAFT_437249 [Stachybotrys elegans]|uniref:Steroid 5-alpha reductase C-terminal domain-containing protein n=1 Tax=Stachybotrys elegans TaxID=80388 RepID=A0A8K0SNG5_9HYPO|nr:hypothetical protein B0I35DRAFT_437249 [Stachybotrys elegans]
MASSGAEQDRYASHFDSGKLPSARLPARSGAEQDIYGSHLDPNGKLPSVRDLAAKVTQTSGAEQDVYGGWFGGRRIPVDNVTSQLPQGSGAEQDRLGAHFEPGRSSVNPTAIGLLQSSILPSFGLHAGLGALAYGVSRYTDTAEGKDWLWPAGMTANAWWSAIGSRVVYDGLSIPQAWSTLNYSEKLLLTGVSAWGLRLFYRIASRRVKRGSDDPRYAEAKKDPKFWNKAFFSLFLPEAVAQTLISLPFTLPFRATVHSAIVSPPVEDASLFHNLAVFFFSAGFALEVIADSQLESQKKRNPEALNRDGVWSIVRHPKYVHHLAYNLPSD